MAFLIDGLLAQGAFVVATIYAVTTATPSVDMYGNATSDPTALGDLLLAASWFAMIGIWIWNRSVRRGRTGQSVGKSAMRIRLISAASGQPVGLGLAFGRDCAHVLESSFFSLGYLWPLWDPMNQTFSDKICSTVVVTA
ncbi:RDD family protein [Pengzhenrongella sicca]|uniref:RDD family protein n=1 Tax=Pengzhenrongella sicca TaxID=2819238 RepID=A0A8A4ZDW3_9MICO|nr:RDD family protein [Pengzhenrongella sicca]